MKATRPISLHNRKQKIDALCLRLQEVLYDLHVAQTKREETLAGKRLRSVSVQLSAVLSRPVK